MNEINKCNSRKLSTGFVSHELYFWHNNIVAMGSEKAGIYIYYIYTYIYIFILSLL